MGGELFLIGGDEFLVEVFCVSFCLTLAFSFLLLLLLLFPPDVVLTKFAFVLPSPSFEVGLMLLAFALVLLVFGLLLFLFLFSLTLILFLLPFLLRSLLMPPLVWLTSSSPPLELSVVVDAESKLSSSLRLLLLFAFAFRCCCCCCCLLFLPLRFWLIGVDGDLETFGEDWNGIKITLIASNSVYET